MEILNPLKENGSLSVKIKVQKPVISYLALGRALRISNEIIVGVKHRYLQIKIRNVSRSLVRMRYPYEITSSNKAKP